MTPEGRVRVHLRNTARAAGFEHRKLRWIGRTGAPDEFLYWPHAEGVIYPPLAVYVEVKRPGEAPEPHQQREIDRLRKAGFWVEVIDSVESADALIERLTALTRMVKVR